MATHWVMRAVLLAAGLGSAGAMEKMTATWDRLCPDTQRGELSVATRDGKTAKGACQSTRGSELTLQHGGKLVKIERAEITGIRMRTSVKHFGFRERIDDVGLAILLGGFSLVPEALQPLGFVSVPVYLAYEVVAVP